MAPLTQASVGCEIGRLKRNHFYQRIRIDLKQQKQCSM